MQCVWITYSTCILNLHYSQKSNNIVYYQRYTHIYKYGICINSIYNTLILRKSFLSGVALLLHRLQVQSAANVGCCCVNSVLSVNFSSDILCPWVSRNSIYETLPCQGESRWTISGTQKYTVQMVWLQILITWYWLSMNLYYDHAKDVDCVFKSRSWTQAHYTLGDLLPVCCTKI